MSRQNTARKLINLVVVLDGNFDLGCGPEMDYSSIHVFHYILQRTDAIMNEVLRTNCVRSSIPHCMLITDQ
jgi:hypothetical protein